MLWLLLWALSRAKTMCAFVYIDAENTYFATKPHEKSLTILYYTLIIRKIFFQLHSYISQVSAEYSHMR